MLLEFGKRHVAAIGVHAPRCRSSRSRRRARSATGSCRAGLSIFSLRSSRRVFSAFCASWYSLRSHSSTSCKRALDAHLLPRHHDTGRPKTASPRSAGRAAGIPPRHSPRRASRARRKCSPSTRETPGMGDAPSGTCSSFLRALVLVGIALAWRKRRLSRTHRARATISLRDDRRFVPGPSDPGSLDAAGEVDRGRGVELEVRTPRACFFRHVELRPARS